MIVRRRRGLASPNRRRAAGFTLVEVLVALLLMAILSGLGWRALDGMLRARDASRDVIDRTSRLATVLVQWQQDLESLHDTGQVPPLAFDGATVRMTLRSDAGVAIVAWSVRGGLWQRWAGPPATRSAELQEAWLRSQQLLGNEPGHVTLAEGASQWQLYASRGGQWSNAMSSGDVAPPPSTPASGVAPLPPREQLPDGVRIVVMLDGRTLTRDVALGPS